MRNIWTIAKREYKLYFSSPAAYVIAFVVLLVLGILFYANLEVATQQSGYVPGVQITLGPLATLLMLATPAITMRLLAEEQRMGTIELLLTAPVRDWELVVGKWLGAFLLLLTLILITLIFPMLLNQLVDPGIDQGPLISGYLGIILMAAALVGIGVAISSMFSNQVAALVTTLGVMVLLWWIIGPVAQALGSMSLSSTIMTYLDFGNHYFSTFLNGVIDLRDITYYLSITALALFLGTMSVETRRWR